MEEVVSVVEVLPAPRALGRSRDEIEVVVTLTPALQYNEQKNHPHAYIELAHDY